MYSSISVNSPVPGSTAGGSYPTSGQLSSASTSSSPSTTTSADSIKTAAINAAAIILNQASNAVADETSAATLLKSAAMELSLNRLLQTLQPASVLSKLPQVLLNNQVVQARVLESTLLQSVAPQNPNPSTMSATLATSPAQYRISLALNLASGQQIIDIALPAPLPQGKWVQLELRPNGTAMLRNAEAPPSTPLSPKEQQMQTGVRRALPLQQAPEQVIKRLMELIAQPAFTKLPPAIQQAVNTLRQQWPTPQQAAEPATLQKALNNSGSFYEAKLQQAAPALTTPATATPTLNKTATPDTLAANNNVNSATAKPVANANTSTTAEQTENLLKSLNQQPAVSSDQKAITLQLLTAISQLVKKPVTASETDNAELITQTELTYKKPQANILQNALLANETSDDTGTMLKEIGRLLLSILARTQIHQLDSLQARQNSDNPAQPTATWVLELPIQHGPRTDTLGVRIEQYTGQKNKDPRAMQWIVNLSIDLEKLGQLQAQLKVRNQHVKATLWTEQNTTHRLVRKHLTELRQNFERIGVTVEELEVYQGLPDHVPSHSIQRQLIDVHT